MGNGLVSRGIVTGWSDAVTTNYLRFTESPQGFTEPEHNRFYLFLLVLPVCGAAVCGALDLATVAAILDAASELPKRDYGDFLAALE